MKRNENEEQKKETKTEIKKKPEEFQKKAEKIHKSEKKSKTVKYLISVLFVFIFCITGAFMFWISNINAPERSTLILMLTISVLVNIFILLILFGTWIGIELIKRFLNKFKYKSGKYVNTLYLTKTGIIKEIFTKKDTETGAFPIFDKSYVTTPKLLLNYKGIPTYIHREGNPDPLDVWRKDLTGDLSNSEMDIVMSSKNAFDVKAWLERNKVLLLVTAGLIIGAALLSSFFGYEIMQMLKEGLKVSCNNIPDLSVLKDSGLGGK